MAKAFYVCLQANKSPVFSDPTVPQHLIPTPAPNFLISPAVNMCISPQAVVLPDINKGRTQMQKVQADRNSLLVIDKVKVYCTYIWAYRQAGT